MVEPTGYSALDLIGFTDRGPYAANVNYVKNDLVHHGGNIWRVLIDDTMGITPTEGVNYTVFIGEPTNLVERIIAPLETNPATVGYTTGRQIIYNDYLYEVITDIAIGDSLITYEADPTNANIKLAPPVETQLLAVKAEADATDNMIAPTEASASSSSAPYSVGDQLILNNILYNVTAAIQIGDALTTGTGGNIEEADTLTDQLKEVDSQIQTLTNQTEENTEDIATNLASINILKNNGNWRTGLRFKNLGTSFTAQQATALANGDFSEFWNGDYWVINGHNWRIVDNSGWTRRRGDTNFDSNSLVVMPDDNLVLAEAYLIDGGTSGSDTDTHGYANCGYRTDEKSGKGRTQCKTLFQNAFGSSHIASHRELMSTSRGTGGALSWAWQDADVELPSEVNIYGHSVWGSGFESGGNEPSFNIGDRWGQFKLFELAPYMAINRGQNYWLRDIYSATEFTNVNIQGYANRHTPSTSTVGLRPYSIIK